MSYNNISKSLQNLLYCIKDVNELIIRSNDITGEDLFCASKTFRNMIELKKIDLSENNVEESVIYLFKNLSCNMEEIHLEYCGIDEKTGKLIENELEIRKNNLKLINLNNNLYKNK